MKSKSPVVIDARYIQDHFPGIGRYTYHLVDALARVAPEETFKAIYSPVLRNTRYDIAALARHPNVMVESVNVATMSLQEQFRLPIGEARIFHSPYYIMPYFLRLPKVVTVFDLIPLHFPEDLPSARARLLFRLTVSLAARTASRIIAPSEATRQDLVNLLRVPPTKISVVPLAADARFAPQPKEEIERVRSKYSLPQKYVLYVGINKPHKNLKTLMLAWQQLQEAEAELVIAGAWDERYGMGQGSEGAGERKQKAEGSRQKEAGPGSAPLEDAGSMAGPGDAGRGMEDEAGGQVENQGSKEAGEQWSGNIEEKGQKAIGSRQNADSRGAGEQPRRNRPAGNRGVSTSLRESGEGGEHPAEESAPPEPGQKRAPLRIALRSRPRSLRESSRVLGPADARGAGPAEPSGVFNGSGEGGERGQKADTQGGEAAEERKEQADGRESKEGRPVEESVPQDPTGSAGTWSLPSSIDSKDLGLARKIEGRGAGASIELQGRNRLPQTPAEGAGSGDPGDCETAREDRGQRLLAPGDDFRERPSGEAPATENGVVEARGNESKIRFIHDVPEEDLPALYAGATVFVMPSLCEGFGLPVLEAMACGTPVLASDAGSLPEVVGDAGLFFHPSDAATLAALIGRVLRDASCRQDLRAKALAQSARFSWDRTATETLQVYRSLEGS